MGGVLTVDKIVVDSTTEEEEDGRLESMDISCVWLC